MMHSFKLSNTMELVPD